MKFGGILSKHGVFTTLLHHSANMVLLKNLPRWRAADIRPYELKIFDPFANYAPGAMRYVCVGEDIIFPVVSPRGNNVGAKRRQCTIKHLQMKFGGILSKRGVFTTLLHHSVNMVLLKNLPRWRADNIRPYELKIFESFANYAPGGTGRRIFCYSFLASFLPTISRQAHRNRLSAQ